jgi:MATE family multidrug resistance protein
MTAPLQRPDTAPPAVTTRRVFTIAGPAMVANLTTPFLGVVATAAVGQLGDATQLGAVAMTSVIFDCLFWLFGFLRMGTVALTAQAMGVGDATEIRAVLLRALGLALAIGLALLVLQRPLAAAVFAVLGGSDAVSDAARRYFTIRIWSAPLVLANYVLLGWLVGQARTGAALALQILINATNMAATAVLVLGLGYGIAGAAIAAVLAEGIGLVAGALVMWRGLGGRLEAYDSRLFDLTKLRRMLAVNRDIFIRTVALVTAFLFFTAQGARAGDEILAANAVLNNFMLIGSFFLDGLATAAEQLCGFSVGAGDGTGFRRAVRLVLAWSFAFGAAATLVFMVGGATLVDVITTSTPVRATARDYLMLAALAPVCGVMAYTFDGIYIGATWSRDMRNLMIASLALYLASWWPLRALDNAGLWLALLGFLAARGVLQALRYPSLVRATFGAPAGAITPASRRP